MKNIFIFILSLSLIQCSFAQAPDIEWENTIGGSSNDYLYYIDKTYDGGYIVGGSSSSSISADKTENNLGTGNDIWVMKLDINGEITWQNTIGGGLADDLRKIIQTIDGGYIIGGYSSSGVSFDKTEASSGLIDYWVVKLDSVGNIEWQNTIGGSQNDYLMDLNQTLDGGFILGGYSFSNASGDKSEGAFGATDCWVVKLNSIGLIEWENTIGGNGTDAIRSVKQISDGGYIIAAESESNISGDKTDNSHGVSDFWVIKLNNFGNIEWQKTIGGLNYDFVKSINQTTDGGFIVGGNSNSGIGGDKTEITNGFNDFWVIKLDEIGNMVWQNTIGGGLEDYLGEIVQTIDGGYIAGGYSSSNISGDKTQSCIGLLDYWVIKINTDGFIEWQKTIGGSLNEYLTAIKQTIDGGFILGGYSLSGVSDDKAEASLGDRDYWVIKLEGPDCIPSPEICNSLDDNCNGLIDEDITETISITAGGPISFCQGGSVLLTATYSGASVQWKKNGTNIPGATSATYNVTTKGNYSCVTTSVCGIAESTPIFVNVIKNPNASISAGGPTTFCAGGSVILTEVAVAGCTYQWYKGASPIAGATSLTYTATTAGNYKCRVTKTATGCYKNSNAIAVSVPCREGLPTGEAGELEQNAITVYPNPAKNMITVTNTMLEQSNWTIYDVLGNRILSGTMQKNTETIDISYFPNGFYLIKFEEIIAAESYFIKQ